jgi:hypothetical protein
VAEQTRDEGRCINCGFLGRRIVHPDMAAKKVIVPAYYECDEQQRQSGKVWSQVQDLLVENASAEPFCFLQMADIREEIKSLCQNDNQTNFDAAKEVFARERDCKSWYPYNPGLSPKDHFDRMSMELLERARKEFELRLEKDRKDFDLKLFNMGQEIQQHNQSVTNRFTIYMICLTLIQVWLAMGDGRNLVQAWTRELFSFLIQKLR